MFQLSFASQTYILTRYHPTRFHCSPQKSDASRRRRRRGRTRTLAGVKIFPRNSRRKPWKDEDDDNASPRHTTRIHPSMRVFALRKVVGRAVADSSLRWSYNLHLSDRRFIPSCRRKLFPPFPPSIPLKPATTSPPPFSPATLCGRAREPFSGREDLRVRASVSILE